MRAHALTRRKWLAATLALPASARAFNARSSSIHDALRQEGFAPGDVRALLFERGAGVTRFGWSGDAPIPPGSLLKPFLAAAYASGHGFAYPAHTCTGAGCWLPAGHGKLGIEDALAQSCNLYFRALASQVAPERMAETAIRLGLPAPPEQAEPDSWWGLGGDWRIPPARLLNAYWELAQRAAEPGLRAVLEGLRRAASGGTARGVGRPALAKTGTAPCVHRGSNGDGYACVVYPPHKPRYTMLLQLHGRTGREAAHAAGVFLRTPTRSVV